MPRTKTRRKSPATREVRGESAESPPAEFLENPAAGRKALRDALTHLGQDPIDLDFMTDEEMRVLYEELRPRATA
jgi:hypothetical protein